LAQRRFDLRLQARDVLRQLDDRLEESVVERTNLNGVVRAAALDGGVSKTCHADDHAVIPLQGGRGSCRAAASRCTTAPQAREQASDPPASQAGLACRLDLSRLRPASPRGGSAMPR